MAKAHPASGATWYIPEGHVVPRDVPDGVALVGPGAPLPAEEPAVDTDAPDRPDDSPSDDQEAQQWPPDTTSSTSTASKPRKSASRGRGAHKAAPTTEPPSKP